MFSFLSCFIAASDSSPIDQAFDESRFGIKKERAELPGNVPQVDMEIGDYVTPIFLLDGIKPDEVTEDDISVAKMFWLDPLYIEVTDYGEVIIDIT